MFETTPTITTRMCNLSTKIKIVWKLKIEKVHLIIAKTSPGHHKHITKTSSKHYWNFAKTSPLTKQHENINKSPLNPRQMKSVAKRGQLTGQATQSLQPANSRQLQAAYQHRWLPTPLMPLLWYFIHSCNLRYVYIIWYLTWNYVTIKFKSLFFYICIYIYIYINIYSYMHTY